MSLFAQIREFLHTERAQREGYEAWLRGDLAGAIERLQTVLERRPDAREARLPLARAISETGDHHRALALLEDREPPGEEENAPPRDPGSESLLLFRALIHYDHGQIEEARREISSLAPANVLGQALGGLLDFGSEGALSSLPPMSLWLPDIAGRLLARLEERLLRQDREATDSFHHSLFCAAPAGSPEGGGGAAASPAAASPAAPVKRQAWSGHLDQLFATKRFEEVCQVYDDREVPAAWKDAQAATSCALSLLFCGKEPKAARLLDDLLAAQGASADAHFVRGLCHSLAGRPGPAGWSFVRAARLADRDLHHVNQELVLRVSRTVPCDASGAREGR